MTIYELYDAASFLDAVGEDMDKEDRLLAAALAHQYATVVRKAAMVVSAVKEQVDAKDAWRDEPCNMDVASHYFRKSRATDTAMRIAIGEIGVDADYEAAREAWVDGGGGR